jgi:hypothetical protein
VAPRKSTAGVKDATSAAYLYVKEVDQDEEQVNKRINRERM